MFKHQVITTVAAIMNLYWDLVSFNEQVRVSKQALELAHQVVEQVRAHSHSLPIPIANREAN